MTRSALLTLFAAALIAAAQPWTMLGIGDADISSLAALLDRDDRADVRKAATAPSVCWAMP